MKVKNIEESKELIKQLLENIGEDTNRAGLLDTPKRCVKMYEELLAKTGVDPKEEINTFFESDNDEPILVKDIEFHSLCEHHMLPFYGKCHIAYVPNNRKITGLSKLARLVESASRRLQIQEDMTLMIAKAMEEQLQPKGVYVIIEAEHMCMAMRGIKKLGSKTVTSKKTGIFREDIELVRDIEYKIKL
ncbi:MAG: GTP cyclohydrolase I FolE [Gemella sp.]|nr:GTP cyclohydrolase I FolE [Gemella sp.]